jgi:hypothetical protein
MLLASTHIPPRLLQAIGAVGLAGFVIGLLKAMKDELSRPDEPAPDVPLVTNHPAVPTNLFSAMYEREDRPALRGHRGNRWLFSYGDKISQSIVSLLLCISQGAKLPEASPERRRALFALYLQGALAETRLRMNDKGTSEQAGDTMLECVSLTILDLPLAELDRYNALLALDEAQRLDTVGREAMENSGAARGTEKHFRAAYVLLRTMVMMLVLGAPGR